jgi:hypothetical protein
MAVVIAQTANPAAGAGTGTTITYSGVSIGTAAHDRVVVVAVGTELTAGAISSATLDGVAMNASTNGAQGAVGARIFWLHKPTGTTADVAITFAASQTADTKKIAVYSATGAQGTAASSSGVGDTDADPISSGAITIPTDGGCIAVCAMASAAARTWAGITEDIDTGVGGFQFTTGTSVTAGTPTITVSGSNNEDGALAWVIFNPSASVERLPAQANLTLSGSTAQLDTGYPATCDYVGGISSGPIASLPIAGSQCIPRILSPAAANLVLSTTAPSRVVDVRRDPAQGNLTLSTVAPSMTVDVRRDPAAANLTLSTTAPTVEIAAQGTALSPAQANLTLSTTAPSRVTDVRRDPAQANLTLTATAPSRVTDVRRDPAQANLTLTTTAPTATVDVRRDPAQANLTLTTTAPSRVVDVRRDPAAANLTLSATAPTVETGLTLSPATAQLTLSTVAPSLTVDIRRDPAAANLTLTTTAPTAFVSGAVELSPDAAQLVLSTTAPTIEGVFSDPVVLRAGGNISGGHFSRGKWRKLQAELYVEEEKERAKLRAIEDRKRRKLEAKARQAELRRQEAEWDAAAALEAQQRAEAIAKIAAQSQIIGHAGQQMRQSAMFAQMAAKAHEHAMRQRQAQQDDDDMMMLLLMDDE